MPTQRCRNRKSYSSPTVSILIACGGNRRPDAAYGSGERSVAAHSRTLPSRTRARSVCSPGELAPSAIASGRSARTVHATSSPPSRAELRR